jgi:hypothetical protein
MCGGAAALSLRASEPLVARRHNQADLWGFEVTEDNKRNSDQRTLLEGKPESDLSVQASALTQ